MCLSANGAYHAASGGQGKEGSACCSDSSRLCLANYFSPLTVILELNWLSKYATGSQEERHAFAGSTTEKRFAFFERVVADMLNHLLLVIPLFGLKLYQRPSASVIRDISDNNSDPEPIVSSNSD